MQRLALEAYYGWLTDASETADRAALERSDEVRRCLGVDAAGVAELYANTEIDELVLSACCEAMLKEESPLSSTAAAELAYLERQLSARPGVGAAVIKDATAD